MHGAPERAKRADAIRNIEAIIAAATELLATDPDASINEIVKAAGVGRMTFYGHFASRADLIRTVADRAIAQTDQALEHLDLEGDAREALGRLLETTWHLSHRFGALVVAASQALPAEGMRDAHEGLIVRVNALLDRGRQEGAFRDDVPLVWQITVIQSILHGASAAVHAGEISVGEAPVLVGDTVLAAISLPVSDSLAPHEPVAATES